MQKLTPIRQQMLDFIKEFSTQKGFQPSFREIGEAVGRSSSSTIHRHLTELEKLGYLKMDPGRPRKIELLTPPVVNPNIVTLTGWPFSLDMQGIVGLKLSNGAKVYLSIPFCSEPYIAACEAHGISGSQVTLTAELIPEPENEFAFDDFVEANDAELREWYGVSADWQRGRRAA